MNTSSLGLAVFLAVGFTASCCMAQKENPSDNSITSHVELKDGRVEKGRILFRNDELEPVEGDRVRGDYRPFNGFGVRAKPGGIYVGFSEDLSPLLSPEVIAASTKLEIGAAESIAAVVEPFEGSYFKATAGTNGMLLAIQPQPRKFSLGYGLRTDVVKLKRVVCFRKGTLCIKREKNGKTLGSDIFEFIDNARISLSKDGKALVSVGIVYRFEPSEKKAD